MVAHFPSRSRDKAAGVPSPPLAAPGLGLQLCAHSKVGRAERRVGEIPQGLVSLSSPVNEPPARRQLRQVAGERLPVSLVTGLLTLLEERGRKNLL